MKLTRKEQKTENGALDLFVTIMPEMMAALKKGDGSILTNTTLDAVQHVQNRLIRSSEVKIGVRPEEIQLVNELKNAKFFVKLRNCAAGARKVALTGKDFEQMQAVGVYLSNLRQLAKARGENLAKGRKILDQKMNEDQQKREEISRIRAKNAEIMREKRTFDDLSRGGQKGGPKRNEVLTPERRREIASLGGSKSRRGSDTKPRKRGWKRNKNEQPVSKSLPTEPGKTDL